MVMDSESRGRRLSAAERRLQIMKAATRVFAERNYHGATTAKIAEEAGISERVIYQHFDTKRELFLAILERAETRLLEIFRRLAREADSPREGLRAMLLQYYERLLSRPEDLRVHFQAVAEVSDPAIHDLLRRFFIQFVDLFSESIERAKARGELPPPTNTRLLAWRLFCLAYVENVIGLFDLTDEFGRPQLETVLDDLLGTASEPAWDTAPHTLSR